MQNPATQNSAETVGNSNWDKLTLQELTGIYRRIQSDSLQYQVVFRLNPSADRFGLQIFRREEGSIGVWTLQSPRASSAATDLAGRAPRRR